MCVVGKGYGSDNEADSQLVNLFMVNYHPPGPISTNSVCKSHQTLPLFVRVG